MKIPVPKTLLVVFSALLLTSCMATQPLKPTGYLLNYEQLKPLNEAGTTLYYENPEVPWGKYRAVMFEEVIVTLHKEAEEREIDPETTEKMRNYFRLALANNACGRLVFTNKPAEDTLLLRTAIIDLKPVNVVSNIITRGLLHIPVDFGHAAIEGELQDSVTGERLVAIVDRKIGSFINPGHSYTTWGAVKGAFNSWAQQLAQILDRNLSTVHNLQSPK